MLQRKRVNMLESKLIREAKVSKSILSNILIDKLKIEQDIYNKLSIKEIYRNEKGDIIVQFSNITNVGYIFSVMKNMDKDDKTSICQYVPAEFFKRNREVNAICKIYRETDNMNTHIRIGMKDYKVYVKSKEDNRTWNELAPLYLPKELTKFETGKIIIDKSYNKRSRDDNDTDDDIEIDYECNQCEYKGRSNSQVDHHIRNYHENESRNNMSLSVVDPKMDQVNEK